MKTFWRIIIIIIIELGYFSHLLCDDKPKWQAYNMKMCLRIIRPLATYFYHQINKCM